MRILIAEDEPLIARDYRLILQSRGHNATVTENGERCLEVYINALGSYKTRASSVKKPPFDVVILDYRMPKKDGLEAAREIIKLCPKQRIIFASAYTRETLVESTRELHQVIELLQKPFDLSYLVEVVEDIGVYEKLAVVNEKVARLGDTTLSKSELAELAKIVQNGLRVAMQFKLTESEIIELLKGLENVNVAPKRGKTVKTTEPE